MNLLKKNWEIFEQKEFYNYPKRNPFMIILGMGVLVAIFFACQTILPIVMHAIDKNADTSENTTMILLGIGNFLAAVVLWLFFMRREKKYCPKVVRKMTIIQCISGVFDIYYTAVSGKCTPFPENFLGFRRLFLRKNGT